ncbi:MAG: hypothetical protein ACOYYS_12955 [Chloroflexota bacterium]
MNFQDEIVNAIRQAMPSDANIQVVGGIGSLRVGVSWKLNDDPERPNKMSKTISIVVSDEAAQDLQAPHLKTKQKHIIESISFFLKIFQILILIIMFQNMIRHQSNNG